MRKFTLLVAAMAMFASVNAETLYSWSSTGADEVTEVGGKATHEHGSDATRVNYANSGYYTICLNGKKGNIDDEAASANAGYIQIALNQALAADDNILITAYITKNNASAKGNAYIRFVDDSSATLAEINESDSYPNIHEEGGAAEDPDTHTIVVPAEAAGCKTIWMSRNSADTNVFITKLEITRGSTSGIVDVTVNSDENAPIYNLQGVKVGEDYKGVVIKNGKKYINK